ncbi:hypothetical protein [Arachnia propionica]|uniref:Uncharacterized protein n=1 Tax=Arachnia propionica TaxID=1750 RepID=A0A3P1WWJ5_9ACTN|nr:hypothetical protein [Arachnia propionica]RRD49780.1 hypothetical protein EII35_07170 [Arachnia propionica]
MKVKRRLVALAAAVALFGSMAAPAQAYTESGRQNCSGGGATVSVRGQMQRLDKGPLILKINGRQVAKHYGTYYGYGHSYARTANWSASAVTLLRSGSYGFCTPPA